MHRGMYAYSKEVCALYKRCVCIYVCVYSVYIYVYIV